jgi:hypothetical protein
MIVIMYLKYDKVEVCRCIQRLNNNQLDEKPKLIKGLYSFNQLHFIYFYN